MVKFQAHFEGAAKQLPLTAYKAAQMAMGGNDLFPRFSIGEFNQTLNVSGAIVNVSHYS